MSTPSRRKLKIPSLRESKQSQNDFWFNKNILSQRGESPISDSADEYMMNSTTNMDGGGASTANKNKVFSKPKLVLRLKRRKDEDSNSKRKTPYTSSNHESSLVESGRKVMLHKRKQSTPLHIEKPLND